ncbi:MAG: hypothetical protein RSB78_02120, partial [Oscillospiraceae bacterium]
MRNHAESVCFAALNGIRNGIFANNADPLPSGNPRCIVRLCKKRMASAVYYPKQLGFIADKNTAQCLGEIQSFGLGGAAQLNHGVVKLGYSTLGALKHHVRIMTGAF